MRWRFTLDNGIDQSVIEEPIGWAEVVFQIERDKQWHGVFFDYTLSLQFYEAGFEFIDDQYNLYGIDASVNLIVEWLCSDTDEFEEFYTGKLNFSQLKYDYSEQCIISIPIGSDNCLLTFKNRYDQKVDLTTEFSFDGVTPLTPYDNINQQIQLEPKAIFKHLDASEPSSTFVEYEKTTVLPSGSSCNPVAVASYFQIGFTQTTLDELDEYNSSITLERFDTSAEVQPIFICDDPGDYTIDFFIGVAVLLDVITEANDACGSCPGDNPNHVQGAIITLYIEVGGTLYSYGWINQLICENDFNQQHTWNSDLLGSITQTLNTGDEIKVYIYIRTNGYWKERQFAQTDVTMYHSVSAGNGDTFNMFAKVLNESTPCKVSLINETLSRVTEAITDDCLKVYSEYFGRTDSQPYSVFEDGCGSLEVVTTGLHIRQYPLAKHNTSFKDLFEGLNPIHNIGLGTEFVDDDPVIRVEPMEYFYEDTIILVLDKIPDISRKVISEEHYSIFKFGYSKWEAEEYTGLDEFATNREYRTALKSVRNELSELSRFIASGYAIEVTREREFGINFQDDWRFDYDTFIICVKRNGDLFVVEQGNILGAANLIDPPTIYNWRISPFRNALRWMKKVIASYKNVIDATSELIFTDGEGNYIAEGMLSDGCVLEGGVKAENESINLNDFNDVEEGIPVYIPEEYSFEYPLSVADYKLVRDNPKGTIQIRWGQNDFFVDCYIRSIQYKPNDGKATFTLLPKQEAECVTGIGCMIVEGATKTFIVG